MIEEKVDVFYSIMFTNGVYAGFNLDYETARAQAELEGDGCRVVKRTIRTVIEYVDALD